MQTKEKKLPDKQTFHFKNDFGFTECLKPCDIESVSIVPASTDAWSLTSVVTLAYNSFDKVSLLTADDCIDFSVDLDNRGDGQTLPLTLMKKSKFK